MNALVKGTRVDCFTLVMVLVYLHNVQVKIVDAVDNRPAPRLLLIISDNTMTL